MHTGREGRKGLFPAAPGIDAGENIKAGPAAQQDMSRLTQTVPASCTTQQHRQLLSSSPQGQRQS